MAEKTRKELILILISNQKPRLAGIDLMSLDIEYLRLKDVYLGESILIREYLHRTGLNDKNLINFNQVEAYLRDAYLSETWLPRAILHNHLLDGIDPYRVDLWSCVSKYIDEMEKNLRRLFDTAEKVDVILFFDEADALFGKRSDVNDSDDCYANIKINYLLQCMEAYNGLVILSTENFDPSGIIPNNNFSESDT